MAVVVEEGAEVMEVEEGEAEAALEEEEVAIAEVEGE